MESIYLNKQYPVNFQFWKEVPAFFFYGYWKIFIWKFQFKKQAKESYNKAIINAKNKIRNGVSERDFEICQYNFNSNQSAFKYFYDLAENMTTLNQEQKIDFIINEVYKNLQDRISLHNRYNLEYDFYKNCEFIVYNSMIISDYSSAQNKERNLLSNSKLKLDNKFREIYDPFDFHYIQFLGKLTSSLFERRTEISDSKKFRDIFFDKDIFDKIDFLTLTKFNLVFKDSSKLMLKKKFFKTDFVFLIFVLRSKKILELRDVNYINKIFLEIFNITVSEAVFSSASSKFSGSIPFNKVDLERLSNIEEFLQENIA